VEKENQKTVHKHLPLLSYLINEQTCQEELNEADLEIELTDFVQYT